MREIAAKISKWSSSDHYKQYIKYITNYLHINIYISIL